MTILPCVHCERPLGLGDSREADVVRCLCGEANVVRDDGDGPRYFGSCDGCDVCARRRGEDPVAVAVRAEVAEYLGTLPADDADLRAAGLDSLAMLYIVLVAEEAGVELPDDAHERVRTIADVVAMARRPS